MRVKSMQKLKTEFLGKMLVSPLVLPAGIMGLTYSGLLYTEQNGAGLLTSKSLTLEPRKGHEGPVVAETAGGLLNCMGLCNPGVEDGLEEINEFKKRSDTPVIASVFATNEEDFLELTDAVNHSRADFLELNLSCPNVYDEFGIPLAASAEKVSSIVRSVKSISKLPVIAKLSPNVLSIVEIAQSAEIAGSDALCLINTLGPGMVIDIEAVKPVLYNKFGGLSGPCIKPIALKLIYQTYSKVNIPIIGMGGVRSGEDAVEMLMAGAELIGIGTAVYERGLDVFNKVNREIIDFMDKHDHKKLSDIPKLEKMTD
jgi:dihydroorotate dehydrogenase (NAD+) catalytic subunit